LTKFLYQVIAIIMKQRAPTYGAIRAHALARAIDQIYQPSITWLGDYRPLPGNVYAASEEVHFPDRQDGVRSLKLHRAWDRMHYTSDSELNTEEVASKLRDTIRNLGNLGTRVVHTRQHVATARSEFHRVVSAVSLMDSYAGDGSPPVRQRSLFLLYTVPPMYGLGLADHWNIHMTGTGEAMEWHREHLSQLGGFSVSEWLEKANLGADPRVLQRCPPPDPSLRKEIA
jgi:hypothetical protein